MCGILGLIDNVKFNNKTFINLLKKIQHRGQEGFGYSVISNNNNKIIETLKFIGTIDKNTITNFETNMAIGHVRYSTSGKSKNKISYNDTDLYNEIQPFNGYCKFGTFILVHNGNIPNYKQIYRNLNLKFDLESINSDSEFIVKFIENIDTLNGDKNYKVDSWGDIFKIIIENFGRAFCLLIMTLKEIYIVRDSYGVRPLCIGYNETGWCVSSESVVFDNYSFLRDVRPGEIIKMTNNGIQTEYLHKSKKSHCLFEYIYFLNENSYSDDYQVSQLRYKFGEELAKQDKTNNFILDNPLVVGSPSTGIPSGKGYADKMRFEYNQVLKKNVNMGRTFILENNKKRDNACKKKYYLETELIKDRNIIIVDDSLVRGTTITNLIEIFRKAGAKSIHIRIAAPPIKHPCFYGIDIPTKEELIANKYNVNNEDDINPNNLYKYIGKLINADSIFYLGLDKIKNLMGNNYNNLCTGCFNNKYLNDW